MIPDTKHIVAVDLGATSGRVIVARVGSSLMEMEEVYRFGHDLTCNQGRYYWDIFSLSDNICEGLRKVAEMGVRPDSIGVDTWGVDMVFFGKDGNILSNPRSYRDPYTVGMPEKFFETIPRREVYDRTGVQIMDFNSIYQLFAARHEGNEALDAADKILFMPDAISYMLTGKMVCEYTILSTSQMMNPVTGEFDEKLLEAVGVGRDRFADIVYPGHVIGTLTEGIQKATGLGPVPVVAVAGHDTGSAVAAVPADNERFAYLSSGTWSLMGIESRRPVITEESFRMNFTNEGGVEGTSRVLKNITGMWLLEQCRKSWKEQGREYSYREIVAMTGSAEPFVSLINPDDRMFAAPDDMVRSICRYCREHGQKEPDGDAAVLRCIFDSLALRYREVFDMLCKISPHKIDTLHVIGGGSKNALLNSMTASSTGVTVKAGPAEATAIGNIMVQAIALGCAENIAQMRRIVASAVPCDVYFPENHEMWDEMFRKYQSVVRN